jgi:hypothetical protein
MSHNNKKLTIGLAFAMTFSIIAWGSPKEVSAQSVLDIIKPLSGLFKKDPVPVPNLNSSFGTNNANGNSMNVCLFPCAPLPGFGGGIPGGAPRVPQQAGVPGVPAGGGVSIPGMPIQQLPPIQSPVPGVAGIPQGIPQIPQMPQAVQQGGMSSTSTSCVNGRCNTVTSGGATPNMIPQPPRPAGPSISIPPISLPNLGL